MEVWASIHEWRVWEHNSVHRTWGSWQDWRYYHLSPKISVKIQTMIAKWLAKALVKNKFSITAASTVKGQMLISSTDGGGMSWHWGGGMLLQCHGTGNLATPSAHCGMMSPRAEATPSPTGGDSVQHFWFLCPPITLTSSKCWSWANGMRPENRHF